MRISVAGKWWDPPPLCWGKAVGVQGRECWGAPAPGSPVGGGQLGAGECIVSRETFGKASIS